VDNERDDDGGGKTSARALRYGSVCSGIEAASVAWASLGWHTSFLSEIEAFPRAVLQHHYPEAPLHGDFTTIGADDYGPIDLLVGGTPCQSFSVAGLRGGLADKRGNLALEYLRLADRKKPRWVLWENVPGVLSSGGGRDFGSFLGGLGELGYGFAYRVLDAQYFGLAQRRKRVFVVGYLGDWRRAAAVLFEPASLRGDFAPSREAREGVAPTISSRPTGGGGLGTDFDLDGGLIAPPLTHNPYGDHESREGLLVARSLNAHPNRSDGESETFITHSLRASGFDASEDGTGRGTPLVPIDLQNMRMGGDTFGTLDTTRPTRGGGQAVMGFQSSQSGVRSADTHATLDANNGSRRHNGAIVGSAVRRLTPRECERLQGFPDDYTAIPYRNGTAADGPRYKALGNSMAVPVMRWIGQRIGLAA
jgi:DNA (cytosine-5)-methyltransferase 1